MHNKCIAKQNHQWCSNTREKEGSRVYPELCHTVQKWMKVLMVLGKSGVKTMYKKVQELKAKREARGALLQS